MAKSTVTTPVTTEDTSLSIKTAQAVKFVESTSLYGATVTVVNGALQYDPRKAAVLQALSADATLTDTVTYSYVDAKGKLVTTSTNVAVTGANDVPVITIANSTIAGAITEGTAATQATTGKIAFADADLLDLHTASQSLASVSLNGVTIDRANLGQIGDLTLSAVNPLSRSVGWSYSVNDTDLNHLGKNDTLTLTYNVTITDKSNAKLVQPVTITLRGTNDAPDVSVVNPATLTEGDAGTPAPGSFSLFGLVTASDADQSDTPIYVANSATVALASGSASVNKGLITVDADGTVHYDRAAFDFLAAGEKAAFDITFQVQSGADVVTKTVTFTVDGEDDTPSRIRAIEGPIAGALVFRDSNPNGSQDAGEAYTYTDSDGYFTLGGTGNLLLVGGKDIATGLDFTGTLSAPEGSAVITPLTTLINTLVSTSGGSLTVIEAETLVQRALGLDTSTNLLTIDPYAVAQAGGAEAAEALAIYAAGVMVYNTVAIIGAVAPQGQAAVFSEMAKQLLATDPAAAPTLDLTNTVTLQEIANNVRSAAPIAAVFDSNTAIADAVTGTGGTSAILQTVAEAAFDAQAPDDARVPTIIPTGFETGAQTFTGSAGYDTLIFEGMSADQSFAVILNPANPYWVEWGYDQNSPNVIGGKLDGSTISQIENISIDLTGATLPAGPEGFFDLKVAGNERNNTLEVIGPGLNNTDTSPDAATYTMVYTFGFGGEDLIKADGFDTMFIVPMSGNDRVVLGTDYQYAAIWDTADGTTPNIETPPAGVVPSSGDDIYELGSGIDYLAFLGLGSGHDIIRNFGPEDYIYLNYGLVGDPVYAAGKTVFNFSDGSTITVEGTTPLKVHDIPLREFGTSYWAQDLHVVVTGDNVDGTSRTNTLTGSRDDDTLTGGNATNGGQVYNDFDAKGGSDHLIGGSPSAGSFVKNTFVLDDLTTADHVTGGTTSGGHVVNILKARGSHNPDILTVTAAEWTLNGEKLNVNNIKDEFHFQAGDGHDVIDMSQSGIQFVYLSDGDGNDTFTGADASDRQASNYMGYGRGMNTFIGGSATGPNGSVYNELHAGDDLRNILIGGDATAGGQARNKFFGGAVGDTLIAGSASDSGTVENIMRGGGGSDTFVFKQGSGTGTIHDFAKWWDKLDLRDYVSSFGDLEDQVTYGSDDTGAYSLITLDQTSTIKLLGVTSLSASDFLWA